MDDVLEYVKEKKKLHGKLTSMRNKDNIGLNGVVNLKIYEMHPTGARKHRKELCFNTGNGEYY